MKIKKYSAGTVPGCGDGMTTEWLTSCPDNKAEVVREAVPGSFIALRGKMVH